MKKLKAKIMIMNLIKMKIKKSLKNNNQIMINSRKYYNHPNQKKVAEAVTQL